MTEGKENEMAYKMEALRMAINIHAAGKQPSGAEYAPAFTPSDVLDTAKQIWEWASGGEVVVNIDTFVAQCSQCGRKSVYYKSIGSTCGAPTPEGPCLGRLAPYRDPLDKK